MQSINFATVNAQEFFNLIKKATKKSSHDVKFAVDWSCMFIGNVRIPLPMVVANFEEDYDKKVTVTKSQRTKFLKGLEKFGGADVTIGAVNGGIEIKNERGAKEVVKCCVSQVFHEKEKEGVQWKEKCIIPLNKKMWSMMEEALEVASKDPLRPVFNCIYFDDGNIVATDTRALKKFSGVADFSGNFLLHREDFQVLKNIWNGKDDMVVFGNEKDNRDNLIKCGDIEVKSCIGTYPNYAGLFTKPIASPELFRIKSGEFRDLILQGRKLTKDTNIYVLTMVRDGKVTFKMMSGNIGESINVFDMWQAEIDTEYDGMYVEYYKYNDALQYGLPKEDKEVSFKGGDTHEIYGALLVSDQYSGLVMPMAFNSDVYKEFGEDAEELYKQIKNEKENK